MKEQGYLPTEDVHILSATVSERAGHWFVSVQVEMEIPDPEPVEKGTAGVDLGVLRMATVSDGKCVDNPRALKREPEASSSGIAAPRISTREGQRQLARRRCGKLARAHYRVANIRKDALHQATSWLAKTKSAIVLEDLNVSGMLKNHHLAQAIADVGLYEFRRQLGYKGKWYGCEICIADRFYPSSKRCSGCGQVKPELASERTRVSLWVLWPGDGPGLERGDQSGTITLPGKRKTYREFRGKGQTCFAKACGEHVRPDYPATLDEAGTELISVVDRFKHISENGN